MNNAIELTNVSKSYPGVLALNNIDLKVQKGSIHGFIGPNGAGKSTTMKIIAGLIPASSGKVLVNNKNISEHHSETKTMVGVLPENPPLYSSMRVKEYLEFCQQINTFESLDKEMILRVIKKCGLVEVSGRLIGNLSRGYKQRVAIAQTLVFNPEIIILDEPTVGLDPNAIVDIRSLITELKKDHTILLSTHQLHEVALICDHITIISKGNILKSGTLDDVQREFSHYKTFDALVNNVPTELIKDLMKKSFVKDVTTSDCEENTLLELKVDASEDFRSQLTSILAEQASLLEFKEKKIELEDVFKLVVSDMKSKSQFNQEVKR